MKHLAQEEELGVEPRRAPPLQEQLGSSESQGRAGRKERCKKQGRVQLGQT